MVLGVTEIRQALDSALTRVAAPAHETTRYRLDQRTCFYCMSKSVIAACCMFLAGCGQRLVAVEISDSWFTCARDRDCTILEDPRCQVIPISRQYADSFAAWVRRNRAEQVRNEPCARNDSQYSASCDAGRCTSNLIRSDGPASGCRNASRSR